MKTYLKLILFILFFLSFTKGYSQTHEWAKSFSSLQSSSIAVVYSLAADSLENIYTNITTKDSVSIDSQYFNGSSTVSFLCKFDKNGNLIWHKKPIEIIGSNNLYDVKVINSNCIVVFGALTGTKLKLTKNDSIIGKSSSDYSGFLLFYDSSGNLIRHHKIYKGSKNSIVNAKAMEIDKNGDIYLSFVKALKTDGEMLYDSGSISLSSNITSNIIVKYSNLIDSIYWYKEFPSTNNLRVSTIKVGDDNNLYVASNIYGGKFTLNGVNYNYSKNYIKAFLIILKTDGNYIYSKPINSDSTQEDAIVDVSAKDTNNIYLFGSMQDSLLNNNKWFFPNTPNNQDGGYPYVGNFSTQNSPKWIKISNEKIAISSFSTYDYMVRFNHVYSHLTSDKNGYLYVNFSFFSFINNGPQKIAIGGLISDTSSRFTSFFIKFDPNGNALWLRGIIDDSSSTLYNHDLTVDIKNNLIYCGRYYGDVKFKPFNFTSKYSAASGFLTKVSDYYINRGYVIPGPYCAGDTLKIPYSIYGNYDTTNEFVAEISDAFGNFDGDEYELGRIKSTVEDTIKGLLPLFNVASSAKYRIRVRSTSPIVQSFYKEDTLQLLVYSRDTANAGSDQYACLGDSIELKSYGGTLWQWSPGNIIKDSSFWKTIAYPKVDTEFKIVISDSSGCGANDTDYVKVFIRPPLEISTSFNDTTLCEGQSVTLFAKTKGGDTTNHYIWWYEIIDKDTNLIDSGKTKTYSTYCDETSTYLSRTTDTGKIVMAVLWDSCTTIRDTQIYLINVYDSLLLNISNKRQITKTKFKDSTICKGQSVTLFGNAKGGKNIFYYHWFDQNNKLISNNDSVTFAPDTTTNYQVILTDSCSNKNDTFYFKINVRQPLLSKLFDVNTTKLLNNDTTVCFGSVLKLSSKNSGGDSSKYGFEWWVKGFEFSKSDSITLNFTKEDTTLQFTHILYDNCTLLSDTNLFTIKVLHKIKSTILVPDTVCYGQNSNLKISASGGKNIYNFNWYYNNVSFSKKDTVNSVLSSFDSSGLKQFSVSVSDGCSQNDSLSFKVFIRSPLSLKIFSDKQKTIDFKDTTLCLGQSLKLYSKGFGGDNSKYSFEWWVLGSEFSIADTATLSPTKNTDYFVVLKDNCSPKNDTFSFKIFVNPALKVGIVNSVNKLSMPSDSNFCYGQTLKLKSKNSGGDTGNYSFQWSVDGLQFSNADTFSYTFLKENSSQKIQLILTDNCTINPDTIQLNIFTKPKLKIQSNPIDTLCFGENFVQKMNISGGDSSKYSYQFSVGSLQISNKDSAKIPSDSSGTHSIKIIVKDGCSIPNDSLVLDYFVREKLEISSIVSDTFCAGNIINAFALTKGGKINQYKISWFWNQNLISNNDSISFKIPITDEGKLNNLQLILADNCSENDTASFNVFVNPTLTYEIINSVNNAKLPTDTSLCFGQTMKFNAKISGTNSITYTSKWLVDGVEVSTTDSLEYTFLKENTTQKIQFILTDNCSNPARAGDTSTINITTKSKLKIQSNPIDTLCLEQTFIQKIKVTGGDSLNYSYQWSVSGVQFSVADSAKIPTQNSGNNAVKIIVKDACSIPNDSMVLNYFVREKLEVSTIIADTFCAGNTINASALAKGGNPAKYSFEWSVNGLQFSNTKNFIYQIQSSDEGKLNEIKVKISDNCSQTNDSFIKNIFVSNPLKISLTIDSNCVNNKAKIIANATGGKASNYQFDFFVDDIFKEKNNIGSFNFADNKTTKIKVQISDNCSTNIDSVIINLPAFLPKISATINPIDDCLPLEVFLKINNENGTQNTYDWNLGNGDFITNISTDTASYIYLNSGTFIGNIKAKTNNNCEVNLVLDKVEVRQLPKVNFTWSPTEITLPNAQVDFQNLGDNKDNFIWQINDSNFSEDFNSKYVFNENGFYLIKLIAENEFNCKDSTTKELFIEDLVTYYIPNVFTPNNDNLNDEFTPIVTGIKSYEIFIYNRWGQQIFEGNMNQHWDGKYNNAAVPDGTYIYQIRLLRNDKKVIYEKGIINVLH